MSTPVTVVIGYQSQPERSKQLHDELSALIAEVVAREVDCLGIQLLVHADDHTQILLYELWTSREAFTGPHMQTAHIGAFMAKARDFLAGAPSIAFWHLSADVHR
ncbi:MAG: antibiotic biosynthesis monooxygenase [Gemmatimonadaceae bacterium]